MSKTTTEIAKAKAAFTPKDGARAFCCALRIGDHRSRTFHQQGFVQQHVPLPPRRRTVTQHVTSPQATLKNLFFAGDVAHKSLSKLSAGFATTVANANKLVRGRDVLGAR